jgi:FKBP12-rapamycin complex-associated protein
MVAAALTFGKILQVGGPGFTENIIETEVQRAVELMTVDKTEHGRYAGVVILTEIATYASPQFYRYVNLILDKIVTPLRDFRVSHCAHVASSDSDPYRKTFAKALDPFWPKV